MSNSDGCHCGGAGCACCGSTTPAKLAEIITRNMGDADATLAALAAVGIKGEKLADAEATDAKEQELRAAGHEVIRVQVDVYDKPADLAQRIAETISEARAVAASDALETARRWETGVVEYWPARVVREGTEPAFSGRIAGVQEEVEKLHRDTRLATAPGEWMYVVDANGGVVGMIRPRPH